MSSIPATEFVTTRLPFAAQFPGDNALVSRDGECIFAFADFSCDLIAPQINHALMKACFAATPKPTCETHALPDDLNAITDHTSPGTSGPMAEAGDSDAAAASGAVWELPWE